MNVEVLTQVKELLASDSNLTLVVLRDGKTEKYTDRGVRPLMNLVKSGVSLKGCYAADKVVGKAAAWLYRLLEVQGVYAAVITEDALEVLDGGDIEVLCGTIVKSIACPMEQAVRDVTAPGQAPAAIAAKIKELMKGEVL